MNDTLHSELTVGVARAMLRCAAALIACAFVARVCSDGLKYDVHLQQLEQKADQCNLLSIDRGRKHYVTAARLHCASQNLLYASLLQLLTQCYCIPSTVLLNLLKRAIECCTSPLRFLAAFSFFNIKRR